MTSEVRDHEQVAPLRTAALLAIAVVAAAVANGAPPFLKRIGALDRSRYEAYWQAHCGAEGVTARAGGLGRRCTVDGPRQIDPGRYRREKARFSFVFAVRPREAPFKLLKDVVLFAFVATSLWLASKKASLLPGAAAAPLWGLALVVLLHAAWALIRGQGLLILLGLRGMSFLAIAILGAWMTSASQLQTLGRGLVVLLVLQLALFPVESLWGMPMAGYARLLAIPARLAGTLVLPNGLGVFAAVVVAFAECFEPSWAWRRIARFAGTVAVAFAGSATGWIVLGSLIALRVLRGTVTWKVLALLSATATLLILALPALVGRPDLANSIAGPGGRLEALSRVLSSPAATLVGQGLGAGTNAAHVLAVQGMAVDADTLSPSDSTAVLLLGQFGIVGAALFYGALARAWRGAPAASPLFLALGLTSLTCNLPEAFPVNLVLGLALAHGYGACREGSPASP